MKKEKVKLKARGFRVSDAQYSKLEKLAKKKKCTPSKIVRNMIDEYEESSK